VDLSAFQTTKCEWQTQRFKASPKSQTSESIETRGEKWRRDSMESMGSLWPTGWLDGWMAGWPS